jgi:ABC-type transporter Mla MlaB component
MATGTVILDCARIKDPDISAVDCIARALLRARRDGCDCRLRAAGDGLLELIELAGLDGLLGVEVRPQPEQRKEPCGVEEEGELADPPV